MPLHDKTKTNPTPRRHSSQPDDLRPRKCFCGSNWGKKIKSVREGREHFMDEKRIQHYTSSSICMMIMDGASVFIYIPLMPPVTYNHQQQQHLVFLAF